MTQVVQARCPHCQNTLRIPSDWLNQPMRCKHCQKIFQTKGKAPPAPAALSVAPVSSPAAAAPPAHAVVTAPPQAAPSPPLVSSGNLFGFDPYDDTPSVPGPRSRRKQGGWGKVALLGISVLVAAILVRVFAGPHLSNLISEKKNNGIAKAKDKDKESDGGNSQPGTDGVAKKTADAPVKTADGLKTDDGPKKTDDGPKKTDGGPKKTDDFKKKGPPPKDGKKIIPPKSIAGDFPRRALLINVNNYLYLNSLHYGSIREGTYPGSSTGVLYDQLQRPPMNIVESQITELSDGTVSQNLFRKSKGKSNKAHATLKPIIEAAITDFLDSSRPQDRVMILFAGHAIEIEPEMAEEKDAEKDKEKGAKNKKKEAKSECYLIPVEGNKDDPKTLIPLAWLYKKLADCPARQKVLVLDVFRYPPARGFELPGTGEMTDGFDAMLQNPPPGVQVWSACVKGQQSIEFEGGSVFLQALCGAMQERMAGIANQNEELPLDPLVAKVNKRLKELLGPQKLEQVSRLSGREAEGGAAYDPTLPLPQSLALKPPSAPGGNQAGRAQIENILAELKLLPPVKASFKQIEYESLPPFPSKGLELYKTDYNTMKELKDKIDKDQDKFALRGAVLEMADMMQKTHSLQMRESVSNRGGVFSPKDKEQFKQQQEGPGQLIFEMENVLDKVLKAGKKRDEEVSPRWQAHYDYALARFLTRLVYLYEYSNVLAQIRGDNLPELDTKIHNGWRVGATAKTTVKDVPKVKQYAKDIGRTWKKIMEDHQNTPWAILAQRESLSALGLEWRPSRD